MWLVIGQKELQKFLVIPVEPYVQHAREQRSLGFGFAPPLIDRRLAFRLWDFRMALPTGTLNRNRSIVIRPRNRNCVIGSGVADLALDRHPPQRSP